MAVAKIKKIEIVGLNRDREAILAVLQKLGEVQLSELQEVKADLSLPKPIPEQELFKIEEAISFMSSFQERPGFLTSLTGRKPWVYQTQLKQVLDKFSWQALLKELNDLRNQLKDLISQKERLNQKRNFLAPWAKLDIPLEEIRPSHYCGIFLGVLRQNDYTNFLAEALAAKIKFWSEIITQERTLVYLLIFYLHGEFEKLETVLKKHRFNFLSLGQEKGTVKDNLFKIEREVKGLEHQILEAKNRLSQLAQEQFKLMLVYDYLANLERRNTLQAKLFKSSFTFVLKGWIRQKDIARLEKEINSNFKEVVMFVSEPQANEDIPVILENVRLIQPFEFITQIYGMPKYHELDPTPFLAPFFFLYFGFCVSDAGYGFVLALVSWFILKKFKMGPQGMKFFRLFFFCGLSTLIIGALSGSWFGNFLDLLGQSHKIFLPLVRFKDSWVIFEPLKEPTKLLGIALGFGIIQVWFGNMVAGIGNIKNKRYLNVLWDQIPMICLLFGLTGLGLIFLKLVEDSYLDLFKYISLVAAVCLMATQGRKEKGMGAKLFYGLYNLYTALSGYLSDILSYSRLWALGLVTTVMASTINLIALQFSKVIPQVIPWADKIVFLKMFLSIAVLVTIFIFGHALSLLMNLLGAFVHPLRLQFVEFFSKFFQAGGSRFRPFKVETKYVNFG